VRPMDPSRVRSLIADWRELENDGEDPQEDEEATGDQLTSLDFRLKQGSTPFVDFAVWRPYGARFGRMLKFNAFLPLPTGGYQTKEINGPASFEEWRKSWRVFAFTMVVLKAATPVKLAKYEQRIAKLHSEYPTMWWIVGMADIRMRSEHMERVRRKLAREAIEKLKAENVGISKGTLEVSWDTVFREAARDDAFWNEQVDKKALMFATNLRSANQLTDDGVGKVSELQETGAASSLKKAKRERSASASPRRANPNQERRARDKAKKKLKAAQTPGVKGKTKGNGGGKGKDDGRFSHDASGGQLCWLWNHKVGGCADPCPNGRTHACEWCKAAGHRSIACPSKPAGWQPRVRD
jgi:hypothetical protein